MVPTADEEVDVVLVDGELGRLHRAHGPVVVVEAVDQAGAGEAGHWALAVKCPGRRGVAEGTVLPVARFVVDGPPVEGAVVEAGQCRSGGRGVGADGALGGEGDTVEVADYEENKK